MSEVESNPGPYCSQKDSLGYMRSDIDKYLEQTVVHTENIVSVFRAFIKVGANVVYSVE